MKNQLSHPNRITMPYFQIKVYKTKGFSLIELMVALVILAIIAAIGMPSFNEMISNNRMLAQTQNLSNGIKLARSEAIKRGSSISLCPSAKDIKCCTEERVHSDCSTCNPPTGSDPGVLPFQCGWIVFSDNSTPGIIDDSNLIDSGGDIIFYHDEQSQGQVSIDANEDFFRFNSQGFLSN